MKCPKFIAVLIFPFFLAGCASTFFGGMSEEEKERLHREYEERENAVQYPYETWVSYKGRLCKLTFESKDELTLSVPEYAKTKEVKFTWSPGRELRTWKKNHYLMQVCGVELEVMRENDYYLDRLQICRKGNFLKEIENNQNWRTCYTSRANINEFFNFNVREQMEDGSYDPMFSAIPTLKMEKWDYEQKEKAKKQRKKWH